VRFMFEVPGKPVPQGSMRHVGSGHMIHGPDVLPYRATVAAYAIRNQPRTWISAGPMSVTAEFGLPRPQSHYRKDGRLKDLAPWWPTKRVGDLDKLVRCLFDALTVDAGIIRDDAQVVQLTAQKVFTGPPGHLKCTVERLTEKGNNA
jgi:Holliday junction resolvase RusA-like endonuclease